MHTYIYSAAQKERRLNFLPVGDIEVKIEKRSKWDRKQEQRNNPKHSHFQKR